MIDTKRDISSWETVLKNLTDLNQIVLQDDLEKKNGNTININSLSGNTFATNPCKDLISKELINNNPQKLLLQDENLCNTLWNHAEKSEKENLTNALAKKMKMAEKILMESHKMRQYEAQFNHCGTKIFSSKGVTRQGRMSLLKDVKKTVENFEDNCQEIELCETMNYIKKLIEVTEDR